MPCSNAARPPQKPHSPDRRAEISSHHIPRRKIPLFGRELAMPQSRRLRIAIGMLLVILGILGFLPVLGFWMVPLGVLILSYEFAAVRRFRRRSVVWWERRKRPPGE
ncbi:PGPGW domain-containing protein [Allomesorhizobium camelthorni]|uniref:PGPGW domain-containing protein n=1 Tax=Allomesorhizobium camelthorni TaxID=475069 RepID=UPI003CCD0B3C